MNVWYSVWKSDDSRTCEIVSYEVTFERSTFILDVIYHCPSCLSDDFILEYIQQQSKNIRYLISWDFNVSVIRWIETAAVRLVNSFDSGLLVAVIEHALVQHISEPTCLCSNRGSRLLVLVITHAINDIAYLNILPPLASIDYAVLSFTFAAYNIIYNHVKLHSNAWRAIRSGI